MTTMSTNKSYLIVGSAVHLNRFPMWHLKNISLCSVVVNVFKGFNRFQYVSIDFNRFSILYLRFHFRYNCMYVCFTFLPTWPLATPSVIWNQCSGQRSRKCPIQFGRSDETKLETDINCKSQ